jgi:hypothetical protein
MREKPWKTRQETDHLLINCRKKEREQRSFIEQLIALTTYITLTIV